MTKLQELKETIAKAQELVAEIEKEESSLKVIKYDDQFYYMPIAILGMARKWIVMTKEELEKSGGELKEEQTATLTYAEALSGKTKEQALAEFVAKRRIELNL